MSKKIITQVGERYGSWEIIEANIINPDTTSPYYANRAVFSKCICTDCMQTIRYIRNNELKKYINSKCKSCTIKERLSLTRPKVGDKFGHLEVIGDGGISGEAKCERHYSICKCDCGNIITIMDNKIKTGNTQSCGKCNNLSRGEEAIKNILIELNEIFDYDSIYTPFLQDTGKRYRFDFIIYNEDGSIKCFIEFDGRQHFTGPDTNYWSRCPETLEDIQKRDQLKNDWCKNNGYILFRIPYTKIKQITKENIYNKEFEVK